MNSRRSHARSSVIVGLTLLGWAAAGCGSGTSAGTPGPTGGAGGAGGGGTGGVAKDGGQDAGSGGARGDTSLLYCSGPRRDWPRSAGRGAWTDGFDSGTSIFSLDTKTANGWTVSLVSGDLDAPTQVQDDGLLSAFAPGDRIEITARNRCQPFSGCRSFVVVRNAADHVLITAYIYDTADTLVTFGEAVGVKFSFEPVCSFPPASVCYADEIETQHRLRIEADDVVAVDRQSPATVKIQGRPYTVQLVFASTIVAGEATPSACSDAASLLGLDAVSLSITP